MKKGEDIHIVLKRQLARLLNQKSLTAAELSRRSGVPKQTISDWLGGIAPRNLPALRRIAKVLETSIEHLVFAEPVASSVSGNLDPTTKKHDEFFGEEMVMISERGYVRYMSTALLKILGIQNQSLQNRPIHEFVHIDDIPSMFDFRKGSPQCFRLVGSHGHTHMTIHSTLPLGVSDIAIHHFSRLKTDESVLHSAIDFFELREVVEATVQILRQNQIFKAGDYRIACGPQPIYICSMRPLLGRLLLAIGHDLRPINGNGSEAPLSFGEISIAIDSDDKEFRIRVQSAFNVSNLNLEVLLDLVQACGFILKAWTTEQQRIIEIKGPRVFLQPGQSQDTRRNRQF